jgi:hypothetical protein
VTFKTLAEGHMHLACERASGLHSDVGSVDGTCASKIRQRRAKERRFAGPSAKSLELRINDDTYFAVPVATTLSHENA